MAEARRLGRQTWSTNADGTLVPYNEIGVVDMPGQLVTVYEDGSGALLGSASASEIPNDSGDYVGWYAYSVPIVSWQPSPGTVASGATATGSTGSVALEASVPVTGAEATGSTGSVTLEISGTTLYVSGATSNAATGSTTFSASVPVTGATSTGATGSVTIESGGGVVFEDDFTGTNGSAPNASKWSVVSSDPPPDTGTATIQSNALRLTSTGWDNEGNAEEAGKGAKSISITPGDLTIAVDVSLAGTGGQTAAVTILGQNHAVGTYGWNGARNALTLAFDTNGTRYKLERYNDGGSLSTLVNWSTTPGSAPFSASIAFSGSNVVVTVDGTEVYSGAHGVTFGSNLYLLLKAGGVTDESIATFDNVSVT